MENPLSRYHMRTVLLDISEDADLTEALDIHGWEVIGIAMPATLTPDGSSELTFQVDPGDGTFRVVQDDSGTPITLTNITQGEIFMVQEEKPPIAGVNLKLVLSAVETGSDVTFIVMMKPLL